MTIKAGVSYGINGTLGVGFDKSLLFVSAGYGWNNTSASVLDFSESETGDGIRLGAGFEQMISDTVSLRLQGD